MRTRWSLCCAASLLMLLSGPVRLLATGQADPASSAGDAARLKAIGFHSEGLPIADQTVTVRAIAVRPGQYAPYEEMTLLKELQQTTNIDLLFEEVPSTRIQEKTNLMFASRDFPDVTINAGVSDQNIWDASQGGDLWPLNDLIDRYAPNWKRAFEERPVIKTANTMPDGKVYSLPYYREILNDYGIRDTMAINVDWLKKVGKPMPATTEDFYQVLRAFRKGMTDGVLPKNGIPWLLRYHQWANGGEWDIYDAFGLWMKGQGSGAERYLSVNKGVVEFGATDPKLKDAAAFLNKLYKEGLIVEDMFTDSAEQFQSKCRSVPPISGVRGEYFIAAAVEQWFDPLPPIAGPDGTRRFRSQPVRMENNRFVMYRKLAHPEAMIRFLDFWADDEWSVNLSYGGPTIQRNADGTKTVVGTGIEWYRHGPHNMFPSYISKRASDKVLWTGEQGAREKYVREVFAPYLWPQDRHFTYITYNDQEQERLSILSTEIGSYVQTAIAKWIVNGVTDAAWGEYLAQLQKLGLPEAVKIFQAAYDRFSRK